MVIRPKGFKRRLWFRMDRSERRKYAASHEPWWRRGFLLYVAGHATDARRERRAREKRVQQDLWLLNNGGLEHFIKTTGAVALVDNGVTA